MNDTDTTLLYCHFDESEAAKSHASMVPRAWWKEISRLRVSIGAKAFTTHTGIYSRSR